MIDMIGKESRHTQAWQGGKFHIKDNFWELKDVGGPNPGWGYFTGFVIALIPALWHKLMIKKLDHWDKNYANQSEREIAANMNKIAGYLQ